VLDRWNREAVVVPSIHSGTSLYAVVPEDAPLPVRRFGRLVWCLATASLALAGLLWWHLLQDLP
jgi:hypothetical protein